MQKGYFNIGDEKNRNIGSDTTYTSGIASEKGNINQGNAEDNRKHLLGSINLGTYQPEYISEAKSK